MDYLALSPSDAFVCTNMYNKYIWFDMHSYVHTDEVFETYIHHPIHSYSHILPSDASGSEIPMKKVG